MNDATPVLKPGRVYWADNGERICLQCAGASAKYTGRDLSGQRVEAATARDAREWLDLTGKLLQCERGCTTFRPEALGGFDRALPLPVADDAYFDIGGAP